MERKILHRLLGTALISSSLALNGCNPLIQIGGAYFPCWLFCPLIGLAAAFALHLLLAALRLEPFLWQRNLFYGGAGILASCAVYLAFFR